MRIPHLLALACLLLAPILPAQAQDAIKTPRTTTYAALTVPSTPRRPNACASFTKNRSAPPSLPKWMWMTLRGVSGKLSSFRGVQYSVVTEDNNHAINLKTNKR